MIRANDASSGTVATALHDVQSGRDHRELRIDKVGVRGLRFPIQIRDKAHRHQNTIATIAMCVDLPKEFKGTHMSRFIEVLNAHGAIVHVENIADESDFALGVLGTGDRERIGSRVRVAAIHAHHAGEVGQGGDGGRAQ